MRLTLLFAAAFALAAALPAQEELFTPTIAGVPINRLTFTVLPGNNLQTVQATLNGKPCVLLLDTGASHTTLDRDFLAKTFPDLPTQPVALGGDTNVETAPLAFPIHSLKLGETELKRFVGMALPLGHLAQSAGTRIDGILGMNALAYAPFRLSLRDRAVTWYSSVPDLTGATELPVLQTLGDNSLHLVASRAGDAQSTTFPVLLDSGASLTFMDSERWPAAEGETALTTTGVNEAANVSLKRGAKDDLRLGTHTLTLEPLLRPGEEPILGADSLLKMNDLIIDAKARRIWLAP